MCLRSAWRSTFFTMRIALFATTLATLVWAREMCRVHQSQIHSGKVQILYGQKRLITIVCVDDYYESYYNRTSETSDDVSDDIGAGVLINCLLTVRCLMRHPKGYHRGVRQFGFLGDIEVMDIETHVQVPTVASPYSIPNEYRDWGTFCFIERTGGEVFSSFEIDWIGGLLKIESED